MTDQRGNERGPFKRLVDGVVESNERKRRNVDVGADEDTTTPDQPIGGTAGVGGERQAILPALTPGQARMKSECRRLNMSPPQQEDGRIADLNNIEARVFADGFGQHLQDQDNKKILIFLYGREYHSGNDEMRRELVEKLVVHADGDTRGRLLRLLASDHDQDVAEARASELNDRWEQILKDYPQGNEFSMTVFDDKLRPSYRFQLEDGNCWLHGPGLVQSYRVNQFCGEWRGMLDLARYARRNFNAADVEDYAANKGGNSTTTLISILDNSSVMSMPKSKIRADISKVSRDDPPVIWSNLWTYGPALVSRFIVDENFCRGGDRNSSSNQIRFFEGVVDVASAREQQNTHAMVLVGMRLVQREWRFLLQNFWKHMPFLEVSGEYLVSSEASLVWVDGDQESFPDEVPTSIFRFAETCIGGIDVRVGRVRERA